jgi:hypothetical protein
MSKMYFLPFRPAFDSAGITVPGSQHWFTLAGTNTPSAPFTDATLATPLENPVVSNGIGYLPPIYMNPAISYRVRIYDANAEVGVDVPLEEYDPYTGSELTTGPPGGDGALSGLFTDLHTVTIPANINLVASTGYSTVDKGSAVYTYDAAVDAAYVAAHPRASFISANLRGFRLSFDQGISVTMTGAQCDAAADGSTGTDDTAAVQAALDYIKFLGGGGLYFPAGNCKIGSGLAYDLSAETSRFGKRIILLGDGPASTAIIFVGVAGTALSITGNPAVSETLLDISGIRLAGDNTIGSRGIHLNVAAYGGMDRVIVEGFDQQVEFDNVEQISLSNTNIRWGRKGLKTNVGTSTAANSILLTNCSISNNSVNGLDLSDLNLFTMIGGSIQYNGATGGGVTNFGCKLNNPGTSYGPVKFEGVAIEGNGGEADLWITSTTNSAAVKLDSCGFARPSATNYATNFIRLDGTQPTTLSLTCSAFRSFNAYVPDAGRPYIAINNTTAIVRSDGTNLFGSATEAPSWYQSRFPITVNGGIVHVHSGQLVAAFAWNPVSLNAGDFATATFAMPGVALGDPLIASFSTATSAMSLHGEVSSAGNVAVRLFNDTGGTLDLNGTVTCRVFKT